MGKKGSTKRQKIFDKYSQQLHSIVNNGLYDLELEYDTTFICPFCLNQFSEEHLDTTKENHLTLEDAPPKSLGGKANTLTCKDCNNKFGYNVDHHLIERLNELDIRAFLPNSGSRVTMTHKGYTVQGILNVDEVGTIKVTCLEKINHPENLKHYDSVTGKGDFPDIKFPASKVDIKRLEVALLKSAYILAFEQYGYLLILNNAYNIIRKQLKNPDKDIYPNGFWTKQPKFNDSIAGVHLIKNHGINGFLAIFTLKTTSQKSGFGAYLPISEKSCKTAIEKLRDIEANFEFNLESYSGTDFFHNQTNQKMCVDFLKSVR